MEITVRDNNVEKALKILKRKIGRDGMLRELRVRRYYEKPSVKVRRKRAEAWKKKRRAMRKQRAGRASL